MEILSTRKRPLSILILTLIGVLLGSCSLEGIWLQPRNNPSDLTYPPEVVQVYADSLENPLETDETVPSLDTALLIEFSVAMAKAVTAENVRILKKETREEVTPDTVTWTEDYLLRIDPDPQWEADTEYTLVVADRVQSAAEKTMVSTYTTYYFTPE
ncbi:MAG: Ig-like domain-containing protein [Spirochaeta sp.]